MSPTKKSGRHQNKTGKVTSSSRDACSTSKALDTNEASPQTTSDDTDSEAFLRTCFPELPTARLKSAVGRYNGDMEHIMDWLLGEMHGKEGELQHALQQEPSSSMLHSTCMSTSSVSSSGGQLTNSATNSEHGHFTDSIISESASTTTTIVSCVSGNSSSRPVKSNNSSSSSSSNTSSSNSNGSGSSRKQRNKKKSARVMHIDEFLNQHSTALSSSNIATYNNAWLSSDNTNTQDRNSWSEIERLTYHLAVIFPQISRDVIRSTLHSCQLDVEGTVTRLANPSPPAAAAASTSSTSTTSNATRGLSRWRPGSNKNTGKKPPVTVSPVVNKLEPEDESAQLDVALCQLTSIFPDHDMDALVEALMQCHLKVDAAINHVLANNKSNKKTSKPTSWKNTPKANSTKQQQQQQHLPEPIQSPRAQKMTQQQRDFWTAHRYQRKANEEGKEVATRSTSAKNTVNTSVSFGHHQHHQRSSTSNQSTLSVKQSTWQTVGSNTSQYDRILESKLEYHNDDDQHQHYPTTIGGDDPDVCAQYALSFYEKRNEAFKRAAQAFRARNRNGAFGAALASFYASEGRDYNESMRRWNTRAAIGVLRSFQKQWIKDYVVDLHYMTVDQALEVALLAVQDWSVIEKKVMVSTGKSTPRPLRIVTGAGSHSHDGRAKLFPRVQRALREAGWQVTAVDKGSFMVTSIQSTSNHY